MMRIGVGWSTGGAIAPDVWAGTATGAVTQAESVIAGMAYAEWLVR